MSTEFEKIRDLARAWGAGPQRFEEHCREKGLIREDERLCHKCWTPKPVNQFEGHVCRDCRNERTGRAHRRQQNRTLDAAAHYGEPWSGKEEQFIADHLEMSDSCLAKALGRSFYAVRKHRELTGEGKRNRTSEPTEPPTLFRWHEDSQITRVTVEQVGGVLTVFAPLMADNYSILQAFLAAGFTHETFDLWYGQRARV